MIEASASGGRAAPAPAGEHVVQFYESEEFLEGTVTRWVADGLRAGEPVVVIARESTVAAVRERLGADGLDAARAIGDGRLALVDARETLAWLMRGDEPDAARFFDVVGGLVERAAAAAPGACVRAYGEMVDVLWRDGAPQAALRLEELWNELLATRASRLLCCYAMSGFRDASDEAALRHVCEAHGRVVPSERWDDGRDRDAQLREIARLQQRAWALETEVRHRRRAEQDLRDALAEQRRSERALREIDRRKDEFLAMLAHELRNPLAPILTGVQLMRVRRSGSEGDRELGVVERQVRHLVRLVDDLLDVSRITSGKVQLAAAPVEIAAVLEAAVDTARPLYEEQRHALVVDAPREGLLVEADPVRLGQVFANLLANAAKYTDPGGNVTVTARREAGQVVVSVRDDGVGIAAEMLGRIFDLFVQGERALDRSQGGLGVGLTLARRLVELHGGTIAARSGGPGSGSEFVVTLPAVPDLDAGAHGGASSERRLGRRAPMRILVVDDNEDAAEVLADALRAFGHEIAVAHDAQGALAIAGTFQPDAALLDIGLPGIDGYELARRLRAALPSRPPRLFAVSGYGQERDQEQSRDAGFEVHLVKPVDLDRVIGLFADPSSRAA